MTVWRLLTKPNMDTIDGGSGFFALAGEANTGGDFASLDLETKLQVKIYTAFTFTDLRVNVTVLGSGSGTITLRDDATDSSVAVSVSGTGWTEDLTDSVTPNVDSLMAIGWVDGGMHGDSATILQAMLTYEHASTNAPFYCSGTFNSITLDKYGALNDTNSSNTENQQQWVIKRSTSFSNLRGVAWLGAFNFDLFLRKDGVNSSNVLLDVTGGPGAYEDLTGTESFVAGEKVGYFHNYVSSASWAITQIDHDLPEQFVSAGASGSMTTRRYAPWDFSTIFTTSTDDNYPWHTGSQTAANIQCWILIAGSGTRDVSLRIGTTNSTNVSISVTAAGFQEDLTGTESVADGDSFTCTAISSGDVMNITHVEVEIPWSDTGAPSVTRRIFIT